MIEALQKYLSGEGYYNWGVRLLKELGHEKAELRQLEVFTQQSFAPRDAEMRVDTLIRLYYEQLSERDKAYPKAFTVQEVVQLQLPKSTINLSEPQVIGDLRTETRQLQDDRRALHASLNDTEGVAARYEKAVAIRDFTKRIDKIWTMIDAYELDGTLPPMGVTSSEQSAAQEAVALAARVNSIRPRLSKLKGLIADANTPLSKKERYKIEQSEKEAELSSILIKLEQLKHD